MKSLRTFAVVLAMLTLTAACGGGQKEAQRTTGSYGSGVDTNVDGDKKAAGATQAPAQGGGSSGQQQQAQQGSDGGGNTSGGGSGFKPDLSRKPQDGGNAGDNAYFYLNQQVPKLVVEIDAVSGRAPSAETLTLLKQRLEEVTDKPGGIQFLPTGAVQGGTKQTYSMGDIAAMEEKNRQTHNSADAASLYLLFVNGEPSEPGPIGIAYTGSSAVIFIDQIRSIGGGLFSSTAIERATVVHEVGHLLALVNQTYKSPRDHEDPEHPGHSKNNDSVMYWAIETLDVVNVLAGQDIPTAFDADDLADLADLKSGKLG